MSKSGVDQELIRQLAALLKETELSEIEIETDNLKLRVSRQVQQVSAHFAPAPSVAPAATASAAPAPADAASHPGAVASPMVGTAYLAAEPGTPPFVTIGSTVKEGQTVLIIEAMKTMNHIPAPRSGKVSAILVEDGQPVEFGEPLLVIE
ncbi:acetyl-CoA carboxylase biotin carboxyl carrier protein [Parvibaculum sp.]|uniref:acetyl-CoA carboxylase biotin carboxyl carrier protein n=1 Tax=Parvibaculum sp. TaxID=2024848 RepID=UPI001E175B20|nr:acetyl-CoA carboxylase biotin carboxyl carrier protein [Parvibaculum sp.]MBX3491103.1 acetyl-CoA carboxylase biotin carboxyl carrier protein [Parvibaculum sp.]MCW5728923.1 acetyl-CoA carboxylase biotin carboxyl carrier protein [Parvibaculum sp.]